MAATIEHRGASGHRFHQRAPHDLRGPTVLLPWVMSLDGAAVSIGLMVWHLSPEGRIAVDVQFPDR
jgi:hypothetical protein